MHLSFFAQAEPGNRVDHISYVAVVFPNSSKTIPVMKLESASAGREVAMQTSTCPVIRVGFE